MKLIAKILLSDIQLACYLTDMGTLTLTLHDKNDEVIGAAVVPGIKRLSIDHPIREVIIHFITKSRVFITSVFRSPIYAIRVKVIDLGGCPCRLTFPIFVEDKPHLALVGHAPDPIRPVEHDPIRPLVAARVQCQKK